MWRGAAVILSRLKSRASAQSIFMKKYYVTYFHYTNGKGNGLGNSIVVENENTGIYTEVGIDNIENQISQENNYSNCIILNIIPLNN